MFRKTDPCSTDSSNPGSLVYEYLLRLIVTDKQNADAGSKTTKAYGQRVEENSSCIIP